MAAAASGAHHSFELLKNGPTSGVLTKDQAGYRNHDQQDRGEREHAVIGERGSHARRVVGDPRGNRPPEEREIPA